MESFDQMGTEQLLGILGGIIAAVGFAHAVGTEWYHRHRARQERARDLFAQFYAADHYRRVVAPVFRLTLKWAGLPDGTREQYRAAVRQGWVIPKPAEALKVFVSPEYIETMDPAEDHFRKTLALEQFTEHEALTAFLYFFTRSERLIDTGLVDPKLFAQLFCKSFSYYWSFLEELRAEVSGHFEPGAEPSWMEASLNIQQLIEHHRREGHC